MLLCDVIFWKVKLEKDISFVWKSPKEILLEFPSCLYSKNDHIKLTYYVIDESSISFLDLFLDANFSTLHFSSHQKPLNKYLYIPFESFHPASNKRAFIRGALMCYTRNSSTFRAFSKMREILEVPQASWIPSWVFTF